MTDAKRLQSYVDALWDEAITPTLVDYIRIPNKSRPSTRTGRRTAIWIKR